MDKKDKAKDKRLKETYGICLKDWKRMYKEQRGVCWICKVLPKSGILCVDHRHVPKYKQMGSQDKAKEVRALLCFACNKITVGGIERRKNPRHILERAIEYFKTFKMKGDS